MKWPVTKAKDWYRTQPWLVGCNFLPSTVINALETWQTDTYDADVNLIIEPGIFEVMVGASSEDIRLKGNFEVK